MQLLPVFVGLLAWSAAVESKNVINTDKYIKLLQPYRDDIKGWYDKFMFDRDVRPTAEYVTCEVCQLGWPIIRQLMGIGATAELIVQTIVQICIEFEIEDADVCKPTVESYADPLLYIMANKPDYQMGDFCGIINPGCADVNVTLTNWTINIDKNKPPLKNLPLLPEDAELVKILQVTDVHLDVDYIVGSNAGCGKARCCYEGTNPDPKDQAGVYGHYKCALPPLALNEMLNHAKETHKPKLVFLTGDYTHSGIWQYSQEMNGKNIQVVTEAVANTFPDVPSYPLVGNHEPDVVNMYPPEELWDQFDISWMYNKVAAPFTKWLKEDQLKTWRKGGYYTVKPWADENLRIVAVNTNLCYTNNFWLAYDPVDPTGQLQWFADTLLEAERANENVLIIGHISPGSGSCWPIWSNWFDQIVNRFENIIRGQFYGHAHTEIFSLVFERETDRPTGVIYVSPSAVTDGMNSGYKIFYADGARGSDSTWEIVDHDTWVLNTTQSNEQNKPVLERLFNARESFGIQAMRPYLLYTLTKRMIVDDDMYFKYQWFHNKGFTTRGGCRRDDNLQNCKMGLICDTVISYSGDESHCDALKRFSRQYHNY